MRKLFSVLIITILLLLGACSQNETSVDGDESVIVSKTDEKSNLDEENTTGEPVVITWATCDFTSGKDDSVELRVNKKLEEDGYPFRIKYMYYRDMAGYDDFIDNVDADVVMTGIKCNLPGKPYVTFQPAFYDIRDGKYLKLDTYLEGSRLYDSIPELDWKSVEYNGGIYCVPNTASPSDCGMVLLFKKDHFTEEEVEAFDGSWSSMKKLLGDDKILCHPSSTPLWYVCLGLNTCYVGDAYVEEGKIKNLLDNEGYLAWLRGLHGLFTENRLYMGLPFELMDGEEEKPDWSVLFAPYQRKNEFKDEDYYMVRYKGGVSDHMAFSCAIKADSEHPKEAFELMQLLMTDSSYGNTIMYGDDFEDIDGYAVSRTSGKVPYTVSERMMYGTNDGTLMGTDDAITFPNPEARKEFVNEWKVYKEHPEMQYPEEMEKLDKLKERYSDIIIEEDDKFESRLKKYIEETDKVFEEINGGGTE